MLAQTSDAVSSREHTWWSPSVISSLSGLDTLSVLRTNAITLNFDHSLSLYQWGVGTSLSLPSDGSLWSGASFGLSAEGRSQLREDTRTRTTEGSAYLETNYPVITGSLLASVSLFGTTYSLSHSASASLYDVGTLQNLNDGYGVFGFKYMPLSEFVISAGGGIAHKSFLLGSSSGSVVQAKAVLSTISISDGSVIDAEAVLDERRFSTLGEVSRNDGARAHIITTFGDDGSNEASVGGSFKRRDFYFTVDSTQPTARQARSEVSVEVRDILRYPLVWQTLNLLLEANFIPKSVTRSTSGINFAASSTGLLTSSTFLLPSTTSAFDLGISTQLQWTPGLASAPTERTSLITAELKYSENSETNDISVSDLSFASTVLLNKLSSTFQSTSFDAQQSALNLSAIIPVFERDVVQTSLSSRLFRYDTPSQDNRDDRDELYLNAALQYRHYFSSILSATGQLRYSQNHLVYLKSDRSAQNYTGQTVSFLLSTVLEQRSVRNSLSAEVFANYSVYDFILPSVVQLGGRDYLIRGISGTDSVLIELGKFNIIANGTAAIESNINLRLYERGSYNAEAFSERPLLRTTELSGDFTFNVTDLSTNAPVLIKVGLRTFYQLRYAPSSAQESTLVLQEQINRVGPLVSVVLDQFSPGGLRLYGMIWYSMLRHESYDLHQSLTSRLVEGKLGIRWTF